MLRSRARVEAYGARRAAVGVTAALVAVLGGAVPAGAWNDVGHQIIALVAWNALSPAARVGAAEALRQAPPEAGLVQLFAGDQRPLPVRQREFFRRASTWPDLVRDPVPPERHAFDRPAWHFRNFFWRPGPEGPVDLPGMPVNAENALERLEVFGALLADPGRPASARAVALAWVLHLVGDVHQPLHCSSRVTAQEPEGDRGGNWFRLGPRTDNLHAYWDTALDRAVPRRRQESTGRYLARAASLVVDRHPRASLAGDLKPGKFEDWARESLAAAKTAYPPTLRRGADPPPAYAQLTARVAVERAARAGYRLAALLEATF